MPIVKREKNLFSKERKGFKIIFKLYQFIKMYVYISVYIYVYIYI